MKKIRILQQYVNNPHGGGLKSEYNALNRRKEQFDDFEFIPMVPNKCHCGISVADINFYRKAVREADPDIVHIRGAGVESLNAVIGAKLANRGKILVTVHGMFSDMVFYSPIKKQICRHIIEPLIFNLADGISCVYKEAEKRKIFLPYKNKMLPFVYNRIPIYQLNSAERNEFRNALKLPQGASVGIYTGRITKEKGLSYLIEALEILDKDWPDNFYLLIVGSGDYLPQMQSAAEKLLRKERIVFLGQKKSVEKYLNSSDFFISPSLHENLSISILEACAAKLPCLVTAVGGNTEIIENGKNGLLIPPCSAEAIADGIRKMCRSCVREEFKKNIQKTDYRKFSDEETDKQLKSVYLKLLKL